MCSPLDNNSYVNYAAFATISGLAVATIATTIGAATSTSTISMIALTTLAISGAAISIAAMTAFAEPSSVNAKNYFNNLTQHAGYALAGMYQLVAQSLVKALVDGVAQGVTIGVRRKIAGPDMTMGRV